MSEQAHVEMCGVVIIDGQQRPGCWREDDPMTEFAQTWRDYCKHNGPCQIVGSDRCSVPDDPAYIAEMELRYPAATAGGDRD